MAGAKVGVSVRYRIVFVRLWGRAWSRARFLALAVHAFVIFFLGAFRAAGFAAPRFFGIVGANFATRKLSRYLE